MKSYNRSRALEDLRNYRIMLRSVENLSEKIALLDERMKQTRTVRITDMPPNHGTGERTVDDTWIDCIVEKENIALSLSLERKRIALIDRGLEALTDDERLVLTKFYIDRTPRYMDELCDALHVERTKIYNIREDALRKFTLMEYGIDV